MNEYISKSDVLFVSMPVDGMVTHDYAQGFADARDAVLAIPPAPVREVKRGKWLDGYCSCCGVRTVWDETDHCPNCGACMDMRGEE